MKAKTAGLAIILASIIIGVLLLTNIIGSTTGALLFVGAMIVLGGLSKGYTKT
jgi:hypothetical protein